MKDIDLLSTFSRITITLSNFSHVYYRIEHAIASRLMGILPLVMYHQEAVVTSLLKLRIIVAMIRIMLVDITAVMNVPYAWKHFVRVIMSLGRYD